MNAAGDCSFLKNSSDLREEIGGCVGPHAASIVGMSRTPWFVPIASILLRENGRCLTGWLGGKESCS